MRCYSCRKYDNCELPWKCSSTMYDCSAYELEQTNEEWIQSATTKQLAEFLADKFDLCGAGCHNCFLAEECLTKAKDGDYRTQEQMIADWLKQQHRG